MTKRNLRVMLKTLGPTIGGVLVAMSLALRASDETGRSSLFFDMIDREMSETCGFSLLFSICHFRPIDHTVQPSL